jgi:hypothetical protein
MMRVALVGAVPERGARIAEGAVPRLIDPDAIAKDLRAHRVVGDIGCGMPKEFVTAPVGPSG